MGLVLGGYLKYVALPKERPRDFLDFLERGETQRGLVYSSDKDRCRGRGILYNDKVGADMVITPMPASATRNIAVPAAAPCHRITGFWCSAPRQRDAE